MAEPFATLLDFIVERLVIDDAQKDIDLNAAADDSADVIAADKEHVAQQAASRAEDLLPAFREGLILAFEAKGIGQPEIRLDDRDARQNTIADALIAYLVPFDLADSRSDEIEPGHYAYFVSVRWDSLYAIADRADVDLPAALARSATIPEG